MANRGVIAQPSPEGPPNNSAPRSAQAADAAENLRALADEILRFTGGEGIAIALASQGELRCRAAAGMAPPPGARIDARSGLTGACLSSGTLLRCDDSEEDGRVDRQVCRSLGIRSMICVPVCAGQEVVGIFEVFSSRANAFLKVDTAGLHAKAEEIATCFSAEEALAQAAITSAADLGAAGHPPASWVPESRAPRAGRRVSSKVWQAILGTLVFALGLFLLVRAIRTSKPASSVLTAPQAVSAANSGVEPAGNNPVVPRQDVEEGERNSAPSQRETSSGQAKAPVIVVKKSTGAATVNPTPPPAALVTAGAAASDPIHQLVSSLPGGQPALPRDLRVSSGLPRPMLVHQVAPAYPALARQTGVEGTVVLQAVVSAKGQITNLRVSSGNSLLAAAALRAVQKWRYRPAVLNGKPVEVPIQITLKFELPR